MIIFMNVRDSKNMAAVYYHVTVDLSRFRYSKYTGHTD